MTVERDLYWLTLTVLLEAEGEPDLGKLAVAFVIVNRYLAAIKRGVTDGIAAIVLAPQQFSCWNTDSPRRAVVATAEQRGVWRACMRAAASAYLFPYDNDPTHGANHFLNPELAHPSWYDRAKVTVVIGNHAFLKL